MICINKTRNLTVADNIKKTITLKDRLTGLLNRENLNEGEGLLINRCSQVHTMFMRFAIDVVFFDITGRVLKICTLKPFRLSPVIWKAKSVLELKEGASRGIIGKGDILNFKD